MNSWLPAAVSMSLFGAGALVGQSLGTVTGTVVDHSEARIPGARAILNQAGREPLTTRTDAEGVFKIESVPPGDFAIVAGANRFLESQVTGTVDAGETKALPSIMLKVGPPPTCAPTYLGPPDVTFKPGSIGEGEIDGSVVGARFRIVRGVKIVVSSQGQRYTASTDASGNFKLSGLPPGVYSLIASLGGYADFLIDAVSVAAGKRTKISPALEINPCSKSSTCKPVRAVHHPNLCL